MKDLTKLALIPGMSAFQYSDRVERGVTSFKSTHWDPKIGCSDENPTKDEYPAFYIELRRPKCIFGTSAYGKAKSEVEVFGEVAMCKIIDLDNGYITASRYRTQDLYPIGVGHMKKRLLNKLVSVDRTHNRGTDKEAQYHAKGGIYGFDGSIIDYVGIFTGLGEFYHALKMVYQDL